MLTSSNGTLDPKKSTVTIDFDKGAVENFTSLFTLNNGNQVLGISGSGTWKVTRQANPEPASAVLLGIGAVSLFARVWSQTCRAKRRRLPDGQSGPAE